MTFFYPGKLFNPSYSGTSEPAEVTQSFSGYWKTGSGCRCRISGQNANTRTGRAPSHKHCAPVAKTCRPAFESDFTLQLLRRFTPLKPPGHPRVAAKAAATDRRSAYISGPSNSTTINFGRYSRCAGRYTLPARDRRDCR